MNQISKFSCKTILFDIDDTLCDTDSTKKTVFEKVYDSIDKFHQIDKDEFIKTALEKRLSYIQKMDRLQTYTRLDMWKQISSTFQLTMTTKEFLTAINTYWKYSIQLLKLFQNTKKVLEKLFDSNVIIGVLASGDFYSKSQKLVQLEIDTLFNYVFTADLVRLEKGSSKINTFVADQLSVDPKNILMVGNSLKFDIEPANKAGMKTALVSINRDEQIPKSGYKRPNFLVRDISGILKIVGFI